MNPEEVAAIKQMLTPKAQELGFGTITIFAKVHKNNIFDIDAQEFTTNSTPEGNPEALKLIVKMVKGAQEAKLTGNVSFTLDIKDGQTKKVIVQNSDKHRLL